MKHCWVNPPLWCQGLAAGDSWKHSLWKVGPKRALILANTWKIITTDEKDLTGFIYGMGKILITELTLVPPSPSPLPSNIQPFPGASLHAHTPPCLLLGSPFPRHICMERQWLNFKCSLQSNCFAEASIPRHQTHKYDIWVGPAVFEQHSWRKLWWANPWVRADCCRIEVAVAVCGSVCIYLAAFHQDLWQPGKYTPGTWKGLARTGTWGKSESQTQSTWITGTFQLAKWKGEVAQHCTGSVLGLRHSLPFQHSQLLCISV